MTEFSWRNIGYISELIIASLVVMIPIYKTDKWVLKAIIGGSFLMIFFNFLSVEYLDKVSGWGMFIYWLAFVVGIACYIKLLTVQNITQVVYSTAIASCLQHISSCLYFAYYLIVGRHLLVVQLIISFIVYLTGYFLVTKKLALDMQYIVRKYSVIPIITIILIVNVLVLIPNLSTAHFDAGNGYRLLFYVLDITCCLYILWVQVNQREMLDLQREINGMEAVWERQKQQYQITKKTIETINRKSHDLKHQLNLLQNSRDDQVRENYFNEINDAIMIYDTNLQTGNDALTTVLMEKGLYCQANNISWTCMVDGTKLNFMQLEDIYSLFGNAIENAIHAVLNLKNKDKRVIGVKMINQNQLLVLQFSNYFEGTIDFKDGLPITDKDNKNIHGFGMKSIRHTAEKYNGTITISTEKDQFMLQVLIPLANENKV